MNNDKTMPGDEPMIDARRASEIFRLPYYWFATPTPRSEKKIPHYRIGNLVRFRASELEAWCSKAARIPPQQPAAMCGEEPRHE